MIESMIDYLFGPRYEFGWDTKEKEICRLVDVDGFDVKVEYPDGSKRFASKRDITQPHLKGD
jgi:hypothetical protein